MLREHLLETANEDAWRRWLPASRSVFGSLGYARICESFRGSVPRLYVVEMDSGSICHPLLLRPLHDLPFQIEVRSQWDAGTPDYTGPLETGSISESLETLQQRRREMIRREGIVAEFAHLHPWSSGRKLLGDGSSHDRDIIWIDTTLSDEDLLRKHVEHACRKNIQKATREGVRIFAKNDDDHIREFYRIYSGTMQRNNALERYAFSLEFFLAFRDELADGARFVFAEHGGRIIAATLYLHDDENVYSFLGGADAEFNQLRPNNLMIWETTAWARRTGKKRLVLGGGYKGLDGIFRFKSTFSRLRQPFYIYKKVHLERDYHLLDQSFRNHYGLKDENVDYFPSYRFTRTAAGESSGPVENHGPVSSMAPL